MGSAKSIQLDLRQHGRVAVTGLRGRVIQRRHLPGCAATRLSSLKTKAAVRCIGCGVSGRWMRSLPGAGFGLNRNLAPITMSAAVSVIRETKPSSPWGPVCRTALRSRSIMSTIPAWFPPSMMLLIPPPACGRPGGPKTTTPMILPWTVSSMPWPQCILPTRSKG